MKLIIKEYLASLKEQGELDAILPDLLSQIGMNVFSRPRKGPRQDGVDVAAVGRFEEVEDRVYLFVIKAGDLTRSSWDGSIQSVRRSLNEILDTYIPNRIPTEHKNKKIVICLCFGGDMREEVRPQVTGYFKQNERDNVSYQEWNGDRLAELINSYLLREELLPENACSQLRRAIALLDEPEVSHRYFSFLLKDIAEVRDRKYRERVKAIRQINVCLWILFAWGREQNNLESPYLSSELALLHAWNIRRSSLAKETKVSEEMLAAFRSVLSIHRLISVEFVKKIIPYIDKRNALSVAVQSPSSLDVNLRMFDLLGRLSMAGIWCYWLASLCEEDDHEYFKDLADEVRHYSNAIVRLVSNNPILLSPFKDDQAIDIFIALLLLTLEGSPDGRSYIKEWLRELVQRAIFAFESNEKYPCVLQSYSELLEHPRNYTEEYRQEVTGGSILFPTIALWAALLREDAVISDVRAIRERYLKHCTFQFWYLDESSEDRLYDNSGKHGATFTDVRVDRSPDEYLVEAFAECAHGAYFKKLSAVENGLWPLVLVACRHYRLPVPLDLVKDFTRLEDDSHCGEKSNSE